MHSKMILKDYNFAHSAHIGYPLFGGLLGEVVSLLSCV